MAPQTIHLPDGQRFTITPVFAGLFFKSHELSTHQNAFPIGWAVVLHSQDTVLDPGADIRLRYDEDEAEVKDGSGPARKQPRLRAFTQPTLQDDHIFISSISNPSSDEFKPAASPTRQMAMMLWVTLYWYFHQPAPSTVMCSEACKDTPVAGRPRGEWRINIRRDGVFRGRNLLPKLERMGLIASLDSATGTSPDDGGDSWAHMFVSQPMFWQIPGRLFLFSLAPVSRGSGADSPVGSGGGRPSTPLAGGHMALTQSMGQMSTADVPGAPPLMTGPMPPFPISPFFSASHLPTYYPPPPLQYVLTGHVRHPLRPKPPRMGEVFYTRFVPSVGQYLSMRVASVAEKPVPYLGPAGPHPPSSEIKESLVTRTDTALIRSWMAKDRVAASWGSFTPDFLTRGLQSRHSFPVIGLWDGVPFGYFELYWVKEDVLGCHIEADDFDRGIHVFIGEEWSRGRIPAWIGALVHWIFTADNRTRSVCIEPRLDNKRSVKMSS